MGFVERTLQRIRSERVTGRPTSANGASSFHLSWNLSHACPLVQVSTVLEVLVPPSVNSLYFWALQVDFADDRATLGGAHTGLQWNPRHPDQTAVNWGGYRAAHLGGQELKGSESLLPGIPNDPNTRNYPWRPNVPYRLVVSSAPGQPGVWRSQIIDLTSGTSTIIRDLFGGGTRLTHPVVWSEVFADCGAPPVTVRWSDLQAVDENGHEVRPTDVRVNYERYSVGGCTNTTVDHDGIGGVRQTTGVRRTTKQGAVVRLR